MSTINGVGTMYYGWRHHPDGTATATDWWVLFYLPVVPLARHRLQVLTDLRRVEHLRPMEAVAAFLGAADAVERTSYRIIARERVALGEALSTYGWTYLAGPLLVAWPALLFWVSVRVLAHYPLWRQGNSAVEASVAMVMLLFGNPIAVVLIALRRARGFNGGLFE